MNNSKIFYNLAKEAVNGVAQLPMLVWSDVNTRTEIYLIDKSGESKIVNPSMSGNFDNLVSSISQILGDNNIIESSMSGDDSTYPIDPIEFQNDEIVWDDLLQAIKDCLDLQPTLPVIDTAKGIDNSDLVTELERNFKDDIAASSLDAAYDSIIHYLAHLGHDLGINSLGIDGSLAINERFRHRIIKHLNETYPIHFV